MAKLKPKSFFEPWTATRAKITILNIPPAASNFSESDKRQWNADWRAKNAKVETNADWTLWGSDMRRPCISQTLLGKLILLSDHGIITTARKSNAWLGIGPSHEEVATRIAACVKACAGLRTQANLTLVSGSYSSIWRRQRGVTTVSPS